MSLTFLVAVSAAVAAPAQKPAAPSKPAPATSAAEEKPSVDPMAAMATMTKVFDRLFPPGPDPDPARLAAANGAVQTMFPPGAYPAAMTKFMNNMVDRGLEMSEADFAELAPKPKEGGKAKPPSTIRFREKLAAEDPNFDAKLAAIRAFANQMFVKLGTAAEPKLRDGMARALARKFDVAQLAEINAFLATPTGRAYGREMVGLWFEPDVIRGTFATLPEMMNLFPDLMKDGAALDAQMKALPKSKPAGSKTD